MMKNGFSLGGEQSGHIIFLKNATTGDGILTSLKVMEAMLEKKASLATLRRELKIFPQLLVNVPVTDKDKVLNHPDIKAIQENVTNELGNKGRLLLRPSGTEPLIRVMVEAESDEKCKQYVDAVVEVVEKVK